MTNKLPAIIRQALTGQSQELIEHTIQVWTNGNAQVRQDILDFFESDVPSKIQQSALMVKKGVPTSAVLDDWFNLE